MIIDSPIISGSVAASGSLNQFGNITITGSLTVTGNITGNITGSATNAVSASYSATATSASYAANATSASYAAAATSASYALSSTSASYSADATSASFAQSATSASNALTASYLSNYIPPFPFTGSAGISGSLVVNGDITAQTLIVQTITSSEDFVTGSTHFGSLVANTHQFTGSVTISGSLAVNDSTAVLTNQTGAMSVATASYVANAVSASYAATATSASYASAATSASYSNTSTSASYASEATSASLAQSAISASYALTASYASNVPATSSFAVSASQAENATSASYAANADLLDGKNSTVFATTGSNTFTGNQTISSSNSELLLTGGGSYGTINFHGFNASIYDYVGQNHLRLQANSQISNKTNNFVVLDSSDNVKVNITGSLIQLSGSVSALNGFTGSLEGTASYALTASYASNVPATSSFAVSASQAQNAVSAAYSAYALTSSYSLAGSGFPFSGSAVITGSLLVTNLSSSGVSYLVADSSGFVTAQTASAVIKTTQAYTATAGQTTFSVTNGYSTGYVDVFINGSKLNDAEFIDTSGTNIVLATGSFVNDVVEVVKYLPASGVSNNVLRQQTIFTASAAQTVFSASYTPGLLDVFYNGSKLNSGDFTANNGTFFTLATASAANDIVDVFVYSYQVGAFSGIGGTGTATQVAYFDTSNSITGSPNFTISGSTMTVTGSLLVSGSGTFTNIGPAVFSGSITSTQGFTGSFSGTATNATSASYAASATSASYAIVATTASYADALTVAGTLTAQTLVVQTITSSVDFVTGSTRFGSLSSNTHVFTGSMAISGGLVVSSTTPELTVGATGVTLGNVLTDVHNVTGSLGVTGSINATATTHSFFGRVGINTLASNIDALWVSGSIGFSIGDGGLTFADRSGNDLRIYTPSGATRFVDATGLSTFLTIQSSNGNVGIGTGTPNAKLDVNGNTIITGSLNVNAGGLFVSSSGIVGIGTATPSTRLEVFSTAASADRTLPHNILTLTAEQGNAPYGPFGGAILFKNRSYTSGLVESSRIRSVIYDDGAPSNFGGGLWFETTPTPGGALTSSLVINYQGRVGIGTTSPEYRLHISGSQALLKIQSTSATFGSPSINLFQGAIDTVLSATNSGLEIGTWSAHDIILKTTQVERVRISSSGVKFQNGASYLNYYEEGTFTPTNVGSNMAAVTVGFGKYVRIGNQVTVNARWTVSPGGTGQRYFVFNLPFAFAISSSIGYTGAVSNYNNGLSAYSSNVGTTVRNSSGSDTQQYVEAVFTTNAETTMHLSMTYFTF